MRLVCRLCLSVLLLSGLFSHAQTSYATVVVFGDSLSDTGNVAHVVQSGFGVRFPADNVALGFNYTDGRFTDGPDTQPAASAYKGVWVEQLAAGFTAKPAVKNSLDGGTNYAYGDATTQDGTHTVTEIVNGVTVSVTLENMGQQVTDYLNSRPTPNAATLYVLFGGANDLYADASATGVSSAVGRELALVQRLVNAGGTVFMVPNLPPLGGVPAYSSGASAMTLNAAAQSFAVQLAAGLAQLEATAAANGVTLTIYQPDLFTATATEGANPPAVGISNVSAAAQGISASPDTYLIWDGLHPTTTGHHFIAATAGNTANALVASGVLLAAPAAAVTGSTVSLRAVVAASMAIGKVPTGLVTFFTGGSTLLGSATLDATGAGTTTFTAGATSYSISAVYAGDQVYKVGASAAATLPVLNSAIGTSSTVTSSAPSVSPGTAVTFTATVTPSVSTYGTPGGTVTFYDGGTALGTVTLLNGTAAFTTSTLSTATHSITASYSGSTPFAASVSPAISQQVIAPGFQTALSQSFLTVSSGSSGGLTVTVTPVGGFAGTATLSCGSLPAHVSCTFAPASLAVSGGVAGTSTLTIGTTAAAALRQPTRPGGRDLSGLFLAATMLPILGGLCFGRRRPVPRIVAVLVLGMAAGAGLLGCGNGTTTASSGATAAAGTYTITVIATSGTTVTSVPVQLTIQ